MSSLNRGRYTVQVNGPWRLYTNTCPKGWEMLGTVQRDFEIGALGVSPVGIYAQINASVIKSLDQKKVVSALLANR